MFNIKLAKATVIAAATGLVFLSSAAFAASGFTVQRVDEAQIKIGMDKDSVRKLLGRPAHNVKYRAEPGRAWTYGVVGVDNDMEEANTLFDIDFDAKGKVLSMGERVERHHSNNSTAQ
jgi:outer membrane protein assembly factor BamE (lipoprotein component of BamABCDE complex)